MRLGRHQRLIVRIAEIPSDFLFIASVWVPFPSARRKECGLPIDVSCLFNEFTAVLASATDSFASRLET